MKYQIHVHKKYNSENFKITVEEVTALSDYYIATFWDKTDHYEVDRKVYKFETYGGAVDKAFDLLAEEKAN